MQDSGKYAFGNIILYTSFCVFIKVFCNFVPNIILLNREVHLFDTSPFNLYYLWYFYNATDAQAKLTNSE